MNTKQLRQQILSLAIQGKLVPQIAKEGTAKDLLKQIEAEKAELIKEGKVKKTKPLSEITAEEKPFEIPDSWEWVRIEDINVFEGSTIDPLKEKNNTFELYSVPSFSTFMPEFIKGGEIGSNKQNVKENDVLLCKINPHLNRVWVVNHHKAELKCLASSEWIVLRYPIVCSKYIRYCLSSSYFLNLMLSNLSGVGGSLTRAQPKFVNKYIFPLPPLSEQKRIVAKLEEVLCEIDKVEQAQTRMTKGAKQLQNLILQTAIQGKLVPQIAKEGTAKDLLKQIETEKAKLIKEGKLKKSKPLPEISDEEKPFEIPDSWEWVKIGDIFMHASGKQLSGKNQKGNPHKYITTSNLYWGRFVLENLKEMNFTDEELEKCSAQKGDLLVCEGGDIGRSAIWNYNYNICLQNHVHKLRYYIKGYTDFVFYVIRYYKNINVFDGKGIGIQGLSANVLKNIIIPLPPLAEQKRIVAKLEELLGEMEKLKR